MPIVNHQGCTVITGDSIPFVRLLSLQSCLKLECMGLSRRGHSVYSIIKREFGLRGNKANVLDQFTKIVEQAKEQQ